MQDLAHIGLQVILASFPLYKIAYSLRICYIWGTMLVTGYTVLNKIDMILKMDLSTYNRKDLGQGGKEGGRN